MRLWRAAGIMSPDEWRRRRGHHVATDECETILDITNNPNAATSKPAQFIDELADSGGGEGLGSSAGQHDRRGAAPQRHQLRLSPQWLSKRSSNGRLKIAVQDH